MSTTPNIQLPTSWGSKTILMGPYGSGKTHSLRTLLDPRMKEILGHDLKIYAIFTEPSPMNVLQDILPKIHWTYRPPAMANWTTLQEIGKQLDTMSVSQLQGLSKGIPGAYNQFVDVLSPATISQTQPGAPTEISASSVPTLYSGLIPSPALTK